MTAQGRLRQHRHRLHRHGALHQQRRAGDPAGELHLHRADTGVHTFSATLETAGNQSLTATDTVDGSSITGTQTGITVDPGRGQRPSSCTGFPTTDHRRRGQSVTVTAQDAFGNTATGYTGTVHFTSSDAQADAAGRTTPSPPATTGCTPSAPRSRPPVRSR